MSDTARMRSISRYVTIGLIVLVVLVLLSMFAGRFFYVLQTVEEQEIGVQFRSGRIHQIVGPGVYSDVGLFVDLRRVSSQAVPFTVTDPEIITKDKQRIGLVVSGDIFRPGLVQKELIRENWAQYRGLYLDDTLVVARVQDQAKQAMKVCVGDRTFDDNIIGTARDDLRQCIDDELDELASQMGLTIQNLVVPEVVLDPEVQAALDAIVQSRLATEKAAQDRLKALAEAASEQAKQEGEIRVEQSRIQEQTRQQTTLAQLERERLLSQQAVIEAERANELAQLETERQVIESTKANELLAAQRDAEINLILAEAAAAKAQADRALQLALAEMYAQYPGYLQLQIVLANASALSAADKIIFVEEGMAPTLVMPGPGIVPTAETIPE
ncbi:MAG: hypothetical protein JXB35_09255 [Anaerolineae bacterium]|nr:hypothetical protein [Anaerolineae bacterium]